MKESIEQIMDNLKGVEDIGRALIKLALEAARAFYKRLLELLEEYLYKVRNKELRVEHIRERWISTPLGDVRVKRRQYVDQEGKSHYLLDDILGLSKRSPVTPELRDIATFLSTLLPFMKSSQAMEKNLPQATLSHTTIHRLVRKTAEPFLKQEVAEERQLYEAGEIPMGEERIVPRLMVEADGVMIALQREKEKKAEVKVGIAYEGWEEVSRGRYRVKEKIAYCGMVSEDSFWERFSLKLAKRYNLASIKGIVVGGDGASWVKGGVDLLGGRFQLDRFHLLRALRQSLSHEKDLVSLVYKACDEGDWPRALELLKGARSRARGKEREKIEQLITYLAGNTAGLRDYRLDLGEEGKGLRRTGAIESNVDKLVANRMKKRGMSWTKKGANNMVCLLVISAEGGLARQFHPAHIVEKANLSLKKVRRVLAKTSSEFEGAWLQAHIPALTGPHANRPWVKALKSLSEVSSYA